MVRISSAIRRSDVKDVGRAADLMWKMREEIKGVVWDGYLREIWLKLVKISSALHVLNLS